MAEPIAMDCPLHPSHDQAEMIEIGTLTIVDHAFDSLVAHTSRASGLDRVSKQHGDF